MKLLFILDWTLFIPVTLLRLGIIYFSGSKYNINGLKFLDVMMHAENKYFNQISDTDPTIDTSKQDVRTIIKYDSCIYELKELRRLETVLSDNNNYTDTNYTDTITAATATAATATAAATITKTSTSINKDKDLSGNYVLDTEKHNKYYTSSNDSNDSNSNSNSDNNDSTDIENNDSLSDDDDGIEYEDLLDNETSNNKNKELALLISNAKQKINKMMKDK
jgi:hypothetical protein